MGKNYEKSSACHIEGELVSYDKNALCDSRLVKYLGQIAGEYSRSEVVSGHSVAD